MRQPSQPPPPRQRPFLQTRPRQRQRQPRPLRPRPLLLGPPAPVPRRQRPPCPQRRPPPQPPRPPLRTRTWRRCSSVRSASTTSCRRSCSATRATSCAHHVVQSSRAVPRVAVSSAETFGISQWKKSRPQSCSPANIPRQVSGHISLKVELTFSASYVFQTSH